MNAMEAINFESSIRTALFNNVTLPSTKEEFHAEAKSYLTYKIGKSFASLIFCVVVIQNQKIDIFKFIAEAILTSKLVFVMIINLTKN